MNTQRNKIDGKKDKNLRWFWLAVIAVVLVWLFNAFAFQFINPSLESRAQNGDMFGPTNALFSGLAFVGLIYTIIMQRKELEMQRTELRLQREAMADSTHVQAKQAEAQHKQLAELEKQNRLTELTHKLEFTKITVDVMGKTLRKSSNEEREIYIDGIKSVHERIIEVMEEYERNK